MAGPVPAGNDEQAEYWATLAPTWLTIEDQFEEVSGEPGRRAVDLLDPRPGQDVIDLGCGTGRTTLELARRVAPGGHALGVDIAEGMLVRAREHASETGVSNVEFFPADVQTHDFGEHRFDGAYSRFGVMFYADPVAAFAQVRRALRTGATLSFVCWQPITANEWMLVPGMAAVSVLGRMPEVPEPGEPGPFSLSDPERTTAILGDAGYRDINVRPVDDTVSRAEEGIPQAAATSVQVGVVRRMLEGEDDATRDRVRSAVEAALRQRLDGGEVRLSRGILLVTATA